MVQYVITPWRNQRELLLVRQKLYPQPGQVRNDEERRHAVAQVSVWMQRGNCPHSVESTAILTSAILNDVPGNSTYCVRAAYSAAFCRFVTGLLDSHQDGRKKLSMYSIAKNIGLPPTYVELRHQATHEELPSLSKLRIVTQKALRWIWNYYWANLPDDTVSNGNVHFLEFSSSAEQGDGEEDVGEGSVGLSAEDKDLEDLRKEMAEMENELESEATDDVTGGEFQTPDAVEDLGVNDQSGDGWALWEGPWVPKPIGVV